MPAMPHSAVLSDNVIGFCYNIFGSLGLDFSHGAANCLRQLAHDQMLKELLKCNYL